jgi:methionine-gamma-lyase
MDEQVEKPDRGLTRREFIKDAGIVATLPFLPAMTAQAAGPVANVGLMSDIGDDHFKSSSGRHIGSQVIHFGEQTGFQVTPISQDKATPEYQRPGNMSNPTVAALLKKMMEMEGTEAAVGAPCGMGIISQTFTALLKPGDRVVAHRCNYDGVMQLFRDHFPVWGVKVDLIDMNDPANLEKALKDKPATVVHFEPYVNPTMEMLDAPTLIRIAKGSGAIVTLDNTWLSPYLFQPARLGADLVLHSVTKYVGGHGNAMGGVVSGKKALVEKIEHAQNYLGGLMRPMDAFLITQGVKTLPLRMRQHCRSALMVAEFLESHSAVARVRYGGLPSWMGYKAGAAFLKGNSGMLGVEWKNASTHENLGKHLKMIVDKTSLGDPVTRIVKRGEETNRGIPRRFTRVSIGLEEPEDIIADLKQAIDRC